MGPDDPQAVGRTSHRCHDRGLKRCSGVHRGLGLRRFLAAASLVSRRVGSDDHNIEIRSDMTASEAEVAVIEVDVGDAPLFTVTVDPFAGDTGMTATLTDPLGAATAFTMTANADKSIWTGTGPVILVSGDHIAKFTITGTGLGVKYATVVAAVPPPVTASIRRVRLLIADTNPANRLFRVDQVQDFLDLEGSSVKLAAATALETIARSEVLISKVITTQDLATDGAKVGAELRASAAELRRQVETGEGTDDSGFDIVDFEDPRTRVRWEEDV
jgi:hypothetical protein